MPTTRPRSSSFFTHETLGLSAKLKAAIEQLAGEDDSVLGTRAESLADIIENNNERIAFMDARLRTATRGTAGISSSNWSRRSPRCRTT